jgi:hypothetical protein
MNYLPISFNQYNVKIAIFNEYNEQVLGNIKISTNDNFDIIINKINDILIKYGLPLVDDFHYITEDGDLDYINKSLFSKSNFLNPIEHDTTIYVYYRE